MNEDNKYTIVEYLKVPYKMINQLGATNAILLSNLISKYEYFKETNQLQQDDSFFLLQETVEE